MNWLKGVETSHGSVAKSSLLDAQAINQKGVYRIGYISEDESAARDRLTLEKVVELSVPLGESGESKYYSLDDLKDLQSKLMLIAAKASHGKEEVDQFTNVSCTLSFEEPFGFFFLYGSKVCEIGLGELIFFLKYVDFSVCLTPWGSLHFPL